MDLKLKILYIVGEGRSGSTLLNLTLDNHPNVVAMGELCNVYRYILGQNNWCACGSRVSECGFWRQVSDRLTDQPGDELLNLQAKYESSRAALLWPIIRRINDAASQRYQVGTRRVFEAVQEVSGARLLVDASKLPGRAMALANMPNVELYVVHLVRDARALVYARSKSWRRDLSRGVEADVPARSTPNVCLHWNKANMLANWVRRNLPKSRSLRVRYEDLVTSPQHVLQQIGKLVDIDLSQVADALLAGQAISKGHTASGNRMRMGTVRLSPDFRWVEEMSVKSRKLAWTLTAPLLWQYGYR